MRPAMAAGGQLRLSYTGPKAELLHTCVYDATKESFLMLADSSKSALAVV